MPQGIFCRDTEVSLPYIVLTVRNSHMLITTAGQGSLVLALGIAKTSFRPSSPDEYAAGHIL